MKNAFRLIEAMRSIAIIAIAMVIAFSMAACPTDDDKDDDGGTMTWTALTNSTIGSSHLRAIAYGGGTWVAGNLEGKMAYSTDGRSWTAVSNSTFGTSHIEAIAYGGGRFVAGGQSGKMAYCNW